MFLLIECTTICKAFVIKRKVIQNEYTTSISEEKLQSSNARKRDSSKQ